MNYEPAVQIIMTTLCHNRLEKITPKNETDCHGLMMILTLSPLQFCRANFG